MIQTLVTDGAEYSKNKRYFPRNPVLLSMVFFQLFILFIPKFQQFLPLMTDFICATPLFQAMRAQHTVPLWSVQPCV